MPISGVLYDNKIISKKRLHVNPVPHYYHKKGETPYIKYGCPVCESMHVKASIPENTLNCPLCGVLLNWSRKPRLNDTCVVIKDGAKGRIIKIDEYGEYLVETKDRLEYHKATELIIFA